MNAIDTFAYRKHCPEPTATRDKKARIKTFLHSSEPDARKERTVFGGERKGLFYNYDDRLHGDKWREGAKKAAKRAHHDSAEFFEIVLNHFHDTDTVDLQHIILGCNMSNGYSYLIFGYTYEAMLVAKVGK